MPPANDPSAEPPEAPREGDNASPKVKIKKYANRRLYNTATSSYVTLDHLCQMVKEGTEFVVHDAKTGEDITRSVLTQIIVEEEGKGGQNLLPVSFLRQLISFYGDSLQALVPRYLDHTMGAFAQNQEQMRKYMTDDVRRLPSVRPASLRPADGGDGQAEPGAVPERDEDDVLAVRRQCAGCRGREARRRRARRRQEARSAVRASRSCATSSPRCSAASTT